MNINRPNSLTIGDVGLSLPIFFPSISSVKTAMSPLCYAELLTSLAAINRQYLVSAFDIFQVNRHEAESFRDLMSKSISSGTTVLMDSGNYESYWKNAADHWTQADYHAVLRQAICSFAFGFDDQFPPFDIEAHVSLVVDRWRDDQAVADGKSIIPIVHGSAADLPIVAARVAEATGVPMIAVPERRLGAGLFERAGLVSDIRKALNVSGRYIALHLLGTGNPLSIAIYALSGADSFDGLEWCQTAVDHETASLYHLSQADFFRSQTQWGDCDLSFQARTLAHNLDFYSDWMGRLRDAIQSGNAVDFCKVNFPSRIFYRCASELGWSNTL